VCVCVCVSVCVCVCVCACVRVSGVLLKRTRARTLKFRLYRSKDAISNLAKSTSCTNSGVVMSVGKEQQGNQRIGGVEKWKGGRGKRETEPYHRVFVPFPKFVATSLFRGAVGHSPAV
jgi:hypothetical protein